ncbi:class F sortase [Catellatospora sp. NPDC049609]|uniref:class F sortase n=1 Tax=Catellatospora sp. NPDC049609 TaxID=3155505 RepID=UPI0034364EA3
MALLTAGAALVVTGAATAPQQQIAAGSPPAVEAVVAAPVRDVRIVSGALPARHASVPPVAVRIPALGVAAPVDPVGIDAATGRFAVPQDVGRVGWYEHGPGWDAGTGAIVLAGHVDSAAQGGGALFGLRKVKVGDLVELTAPEGTVRRFRIAAVEQRHKAGLEWHDYFVRDGHPRLVLITCGGPFNPNTRRYRDNIVVTALAD